MRRICTLAMSIALLATSASARADHAAVPYDPGSVTTIDLAVSDAGIQSLRDAPKTYTDANMVIQRAGTTLGQYAIGVGDVIRRKRPRRGAWHVARTRPAAGAERPAGTPVVVIVKRRR